MNLPEARGRKASANAVFGVLGDSEARDDRTFVGATRPAVLLPWQPGLNS